MAEARAQTVHLAQYRCKQDKNLYLNSSFKARIHCCANELAPRASRTSKSTSSRTWPLRRYLGLGDRKPSGRNQALNLRALDPSPSLDAVAASPLKSIAKFTSRETKASCHEPWEKGAAKQKRAQQPLVAAAVAVVAASKKEVSRKQD